MSHHHNDKGLDRVLPFQIDTLDVRGRLVRLGPLLDSVLSRHDYPPVVSRHLAEMILVAVLLGNSVKFQGTFTVQTKGDGPVSLMVADFVTPGTVRGYAQFDREALERLGPEPAFTAVFGKGYLALTLDQGPETDRYQGIVALEGQNLGECAEVYFRDSEQIPTLVRLAAALGADGHWLAGGLMVQHLPHGSAGARTDAGGHLPDAAAEDRWLNARSKAATVAAAELLGPDLRLAEVAWRLYHEDEVLVYPTLGLAEGCRCSRGKIAQVLARFSPEDRAEMAVDGRIRVSCEFCNSAYDFDPVAIEAEVPQE
ncbi:Hsp33 family molecular chaperone [Zavarzinia compransoris]|uniref:Hsp33 family molecular chaperone n=1 Tax=Zavarzinia compransoris TaxID=1264899 RepID=A0A317E178_9PROT|nr:Hsp33 family molecular chaperone [Zavarzinia compransoris]PWR18905.1 Hsp33 family molecular chaperone [Zavarzinia compransoris]TDP48901.1 molecular chaperone Hsp33 [Zavarzinia compransoris]